MRITPVGVGVVTYNDDHSYLTLVYSIFTESHEPVLNDSRDYFLKRRSTLTIRQAIKLRAPLKYDHKSMRPSRTQGILRRILAIRQFVLSGLARQDVVHSSRASQTCTMRKFVGTQRNREDLSMNHSSSIARETQPADPSMYEKSLGFTQF